MNYPIKSRQIEYTFCLDRLTDVFTTVRSLSGNYYESSHPLVPCVSLHLFPHLMIFNVIQCKAMHSIASLRYAVVALDEI